MKGIVLVPIILGVGLLAVGGTVAAIGYNNAIKTEAVTNTHEVSEEFSKVNIDVDISDVVFVTSENGEKKVVCEEEKDVVHTVKVENDTLTVTYDDQRAWYEKWFNWSFVKRSVKVYLPATTYSDCVIHSSTGEVTVGSGFTFANMDVKTATGNIKVSTQVTEDIKVNTSTGNINVEKSNPTSLDIKSSTGNITLSDMEVQDHITLKCSTGNIKADDIKAKSWESQCSTGGVSLTNTIVEKHMSVKTSTGEIRLNDCDAETLYLKSDTGSIKGTLLTSKDFYASSDTGKVTVPHSTTGGKCEIETDTGEINISIKE